MTKYERETLEAIQAKLNELVECTDDGWMREHLAGEAHKIGLVRDGKMAKEPELRFIERTGQVVRRQPC